MGISIPTGSDVTIVTQVQDVTVPAIFLDTINIENDAVHLLPFIGVYRTIGDSWWLQAFTQIDTPTNGSDVQVNGGGFGRLNAQTLLYTDVSLGKWWYRNPSNSFRRGGAGITGIASVLELHYTTSLNDADDLFSDLFPEESAGGFPPAFVPAPENRFDVLNLTAGFLVDISDRWRLNVAGVFPLREGRFENGVGRREDRFFDSEVSFQLNRFF